MARRRITIDVDSELLEAVDELARRVGSSRNCLVIESLAELIRLRERERVDLLFERMAGDSGVRDELIKIERELAPASDAAWRLLEKSESRARRAPAPGRARRGSIRAAR